MTFRNHKDLVLFIYLAVSESHSVVSNSLWPHGLNHPWTSPGKNPGVGSLSLLQGIFPTQGWNPGVPNCRRVLPRWAAGQPLLAVLGLCGGALAPLLVGCLGFLSFVTQVRLAAPWHVGSYFPDQESNFCTCTGRQILNDWTTGKYQEFGFRQTQSPVMWLCWLICKMEITSPVLLQSSENLMR